MLRQAWTWLRPLSGLWWVRVAAGVLVAVGGLVLIGYVALKLTPDWFASRRLPDRTCEPGDKAFKDCLDAAKARADDRRGITTATLAILAGGVATVGAILTGLSYRLNQAGQITERFTRAVDQLGKPELDVRLGGIYALERIARDSKTDHPQVVEVLTAYVREHSRWPPTAEAAAPKRTTPAVGGQLRTADRALLLRVLDRLAKDEDTAIASESKGAPDEATPSAVATDAPRLPTDVQAAVSVLGRRDPSRDRPEARLDLADTDLGRVVLPRNEANLQHAELSGANLRGAELGGANLQGAELFWANIQDARLRGANLQHANLGGANLQHAKLSEANLQDARLRGANLQRAILSQANLQHANLEQADLQHAKLGGANLQHASLRGADLQHATLIVADLQHANLDGADLQHARLDGANLQHAKLDDAYTRGAGVGGANFSGAVYNARTQWPAGFDPKAAGARPRR